MNVAFENPRKIQVREEGNDNPKTKKIKAKMRNKGIATQEKGKFVSHLVPDRVTGLEELEELRRLSPKRKWNFVSKLIIQYLSLNALNTTLGRSGHYIRGNFSKPRPSF